MRPEEFFNVTEPHYLKKQYFFNIFHSYEIYIKAADYLNINTNLHIHVNVKNVTIASDFKY